MVSSEQVSHFSVTSRLKSLDPFLAHLSRRLIGELIVYPCSGVRLSSFTISKIFFSETAGPIVLILYIHHLQVRGKNNCVFCFDRIRTLVAMATYASHRLIMEKSENCQFLLSCWRYLNFVLQKCLLSSPLRFTDVTFVLILHFDWLQGPHIGQNFEKHSKIFFSETVKGMKPILCIHVPDSGHYIICVF